MQGMRLDKTTLWLVTLGDVSASDVTWLYVEVRPQSSMEEVFSDVVQVMVVPVFVTEETVLDIAATLVSILNAMLPELAVAYADSAEESSIFFTRQ